MTIDRNGRGAGTPRRNAESSVVFSLDSLRAIAEADAQGPMQRQAGLPSFSGSDLAGLGAAPRPPAAMPLAQPVLAPEPSNLPMLMMIGILMLTTIGLAAYIVIDPRPRVVVTQVPAAAPDPSEAAAGVEGTVVELVPDRRVREPAAVAAEVEAPAAKATAIESPRKARGTPRVASERAREPAIASVTPDAKARELPIECVLDPHAAGCGAKAAAPPREPPKVVAIDPNLPETLSTSALRGGMAGVKEAAKSCGAKHGGVAGEKVKVKLSILGASGAVESTAAEGAHRGTALGNCVAAALKKATFPRFGKQVIGLEYTITL